jgi:hypothetical protein
MRIPVFLAAALAAAAVPTLAKALADKDGDVRRAAAVALGQVGPEARAALPAHRAPAGKAGAIVVPLGGAFKLKGCTSAGKKLIEAIESRPGGYYVNVHTAKYPNGAIRGQLVAGMVHL